MDPSKRDLSSLDIQRVSHHLGRDSESKAKPYYSFLATTFPVGTICKVIHQPEYRLCPKVIHQPGYTYCSKALPSTVAGKDLLLEGGLF